MRSSLGWLGLAETPVVVTGHPRMRERVLQTLRQRRRRDQLVTVSLGALLAIVLLGFGIVRSPLLAVDRVSLVGVSQVQQQALTGLLAVDEGANVLDVDLGVLEEQAESLPWVAVATARRRLPSTIEVRVAVNRPVASAVVGEVRYLLDAEGVAVESMPADAGGGISTRGAVADLPTIVLTDPPLVGEPQADPQVRDLAVVAASMPKALQEWITGYRAAGTDEVDALLTVPTPGGPVEFVAHLGRAEQVRVKAASLAALVDETIGRGLRPRSVDVRIPDRPVVLS